MHVIFVAPEFPANQREFVRALKQIGARVTGVGERPIEWLDDQLRGWLDGYEHVRNVTDDDQLLAAVRRIQRRGWVDRLEATIEAHVLTAARVREVAGPIPGLSSKAALLCRDKPEMKAHLSAHGVPCAQSIGSGDREAIAEFARQVGYPLIVKPRAGAGAAGTTRVDSDEEMIAALDEARVGVGGEVAVEEFIEGHEGFYDTLTIGGHIALEFVSHYYPNVLDAMRTRWISPQIVVTNRIDAPGYDDLKALGRQVIDAMGLSTCATHMEWFFGPKGLKFSEIGARPPGVRQWDLYNFANDIDLYRQWALAVTHGKVDQTPSRRFASGLIALRPDRDGHIVGYEGIDEMQRRFGPWIIDAHLPTPGTPTQPVEAGFMANAWVRMRHPDYDTLREMLDTVGQITQVRAR